MPRSARGAAGALAAFAVTPAFGPVFRVIPEVQQRVVVLVSHQFNVAAPAAIAAGGSPVRDEFLAAKRKAAVAAIAGLNPDSNLVDKHCYANPRPLARSFKKERRPPVGETGGLLMNSRAERRLRILPFNADTDKLAQAAAVAKFDDAGNLRK